MKLGPVTKVDNRNKIPSKIFEDNVMSENYNVIIIFSIYEQFGAIRKPGSESTVYKTYSNSNHLSYKNWKQN